MNQHVEKAHELIAKARYEDALLHLATAIDDPEAAYNARGDRAWLLRALGRFDEALADYDFMLGQQPDDLVAATWRAEMLLKVQREDEGISALLDILRRNPLQREPLEVLRQHQYRQTAEPHLPHEVARLAAINPVLAEINNRESNVLGSVHAETAQMIYWFVRTIRPALALETGSCIGCSAICITQAMQDNGVGHLHCYDLFVDRPGYVSPAIGPCDNGLDIVSGHLAAAGLIHRATLHRGDSPSQIRETLGSENTPVDFAFIDGDHRIKGCLKDWNQVDRILKPGAFVLLHDTHITNSTWIGPAYLLEQLERHAPGGYQFIDLPTPEGCGIALIQKRTPKDWNAATPPITHLIRDHLYTKLHWK